MQEPTFQQEINFQREMQDRQQAADPNAIYADSMREDKIKNVIAQLNPELLLTEIEHRIRGEKKNPFTEEWEPISKEGKKVSEELVQNYISLLNVYLTQNNSLSNFSPQEINNIMNIVIEYVRDDLSDNSIKYGLTNKKTVLIKKKIKILRPTINKEGLVNMQYIETDKEQEIEIGEEITDYNEFSRIGHIVCQSTFSVLKQAQNGMLASRIFKALRVNETLNAGEGKSKMDVFKFW